MVKCGEEERSITGLFYLVFIIEFIFSILIGLISNFSNENYIEREEYYKQLNSFV